MSFQDLPGNWSDYPITHPERAADVVDLFLETRDRQQNCLLVLICDEDGYLLQPVSIDRVPWHASPVERRQTFEPFTHHLGVRFIAAVSTGRHFPIDLAIQWRESAEEAVADGGGELVQFFAATSRGVTWIGPEVAAV